VVLLVNILGCLLYISKSGSNEEKATILSRWFSNPDQLVIAAIFILSIGFNYSYICWVVYINVPDKVSAFSQESSRVGRDRRKVSSIIILSAT
jgi:superfamily II DNA helicase RecQ